MTQDFPLAQLFYELLLFLYPQEYRKVYASEMRLLFTDLYREEKKHDEDVSLWFWFHLINDVLKSTWVQHGEIYKKVGLINYMKTILSVQAFVFFASLFLLTPIALLFFTDISVLLMTGSYETLTPLYTISFSPPVLLVIAYIFPLLTLVLNSYVVIKAAAKRKYHIFTVSFFLENTCNGLVFLLGLGAIFFLLGHDSVPCVSRFILQKGLFNIRNIVEYC